MNFDKIINKFNSKQFSDFIIYGFGQAINLISPLIVLPYIIVICGEEGLGKVGVGFSFSLIAIVLVDYGSYINGTKEVSINNKNKIVLEDKFTTIYLAKSLLLITVLALCVIVIFTVPFFEKDKLQILFSLFIVIGQFINPTWFFQGIQNFKWISVINIISKIVYVLLIFLYIKKSSDYIYVNAFLGIGSIFASTLGFFWICHHFSFSFRNVSYIKALNLIKDEFSLTLSQLFFSFYQYAPIILISYVCGDFIAGQYRIIDQVVMIFRTYLQMFFNFVYAEICLKIYENVKQGLLDWRKINGYNYGLIIILILFFFFNTITVLRFFKISENDIVLLAKYFKIGLLIPILMTISFALKQLMFAFNKNKHYITITILSTIFNLYLMFLLLKFLGLKGAFVSIIFAEIAIILAYVLVLKKSLSK